MEDPGLVKTLRGGHFSQHEAARGSERQFLKILVRADHSRSVCACRHAEFFLRRSTHTVASPEPNGPFLNISGISRTFFTLTVTASLANLLLPARFGLPTRARSLASGDENYRASLTQAVL